MGGTVHGGRSSGRRVPRGPQQARGSLAGRAGLREAAGAGVRPFGGRGLAAGPRAWVTAAERAAACTAPSDSAALGSCFAPRRPL